MNLYKYELCKSYIQVHSQNYSFLSVLRFSISDKFFSHPVKIKLIVPHFIPAGLYNGRRHTHPV